MNHPEFRLNSTFTDPTQITAVATYLRLFTVIETIMEKLSLLAAPPFLLLRRDQQR